MFTNKTIIITGGTGSFGNAVLCRFLNTDVQEIRIYSRDEKKQDDMRKLYNNPKIKFHIGDVRDYDSVANAMIGVDYVFHAAALKQVPSCEFFPIQAVKTNVLGAENVLRAAIANHVKKVIVLSTDKAVYPINAMGMSKAMMEKVMVAYSRQQPESGTVLCGTRYGNVMASRGSVIPLFIDQIKAGNPITITDPTMTRYLMSLEEAVELVVYAYQNGVQGDIFVQKSPASTVIDLAHALIELFEAKTEIKIIGTRHGEKKHETLVNREEMAKAVDLPGYYRIPADTRDLNYEKYYDSGEQRVSEIEDYTSENTQRLTIPEIQAKLLSLSYVQRELSRDNFHDATNRS
ncbi:MAG: polysaccharide biosynthesis protein [Candidatus Cloacimonadaceae bacterium]|nr:polysaccharide biosynthesis protein [Candidatus Cloacimonadaceae bacterium]